MPPRIFIIFLLNLRIDSAFMFYRYAATAERIAHIINRKEPINTSDKIETIKPATAKPFTTLQFFFNAIPIILDIKPNNAVKPNIAPKIGLAKKQNPKLTDNRPSTNPTIPNTFTFLGCITFAGA